MIKESWKTISKAVSARFFLLDVIVIYKKVKKLCEENEFKLNDLPNVAAHIIICNCIHDIFIKYLVSL